MSNVKYTFHGSTAAGPASATGFRRLRFGAWNLVWCSQNWLHIPPFVSLTLLYTALERPMYHPANPSE